MYIFKWSVKRIIVRDVPPITLAGGQGATAGNFPIDINGGFWQPILHQEQTIVLVVRNINDRERWLCEGGMVIIIHQEPISLSQPVSKVQNVEA